jgi:hypothetical protein
MKYDDERYEHEYGDDDDDAYDTCNHHIIPHDTTHHTYHINMIKIRHQ